MRHQGIEASNALDEYIKQLEHIQSGRISLVLDKEGKNKINILNELADEEIYIKDIPSWEKIYGELRLIANTVKHAEGNSAGKLKNKRPEIFIYSAFRNHPIYENYKPKVDLPLGGEDIYPTVEDLELYRQAIVSFWQEFAKIIREYDQYHIG